MPKCRRKESLCERHGDLSAITLPFAVPYPKLLDAALGNVIKELKKERTYLSIEISQRITGQWTILWQPRQRVV
jgi:hypothetical protein